MIVPCLRAYPQGARKGRETAIRLPQRVPYAGGEISYDALEEEFDEIIANITLMEEMEGLSDDGYES